MAVKNLMEDIVRSIVSEVLKDDAETSRPDSAIDDITAYVLNRIPPRYITSERGILHGKIEDRFVFQQKTDIFFLIYEAIEVINKRRKSQAGTTPEGINTDIFRLPHMIGEVLEESTFSIVPDVEITLYYKDKPAVMVDSGWKNPFKTNEATMGYYHFWPEYDSATISESEHPVKFTLVFRHPDFMEQMTEIEIDPAADYGMGISHHIPITLLQAREGVEY